MAGHVEDDDMGMEVRIELARGMFGKTRIEKLARRLVGNLAVHAPTEFGMLLDPGDGRPDRALMRGDDPFIARHQCHDRHRLRGFDGKVPPRMMLNFAIPDTPELRSEEHTSEIKSL